MRISSVVDEKAIGREFFEYQFTVVCDHHLQTSSSVHRVVPNKFTCRMELPGIISAGRSFTLRCMATSPLKLVVTESTSKLCEPHISCTTLLLQPQEDTSQQVAHSQLLSEPACRCFHLESVTALQNIITALNVSKAVLTQYFSARAL